MNPRFHEFTVALGWTLIHSLWELLVIGVFFAFVMWGIRKPQARYKVAVVGLLCCFVAPVATLAILAPKPISKPPVVITIHRIPSVASSEILATLPKYPAVVADEATTNRPHSLSRPEFHLENYLPALVGLWLTGSAFMLLRVFGGLVVIHRLRRKADAASAEWKERFYDLADKHGIKRRAELLFSGGIDSPIAFGLLRATVILPASVLTRLSPEQIEALLSHEIAHIKRHDFLVSLLQSIVEALLFFHPVVWWISAAVRREREWVCDDMAVAVVGDRIAYARALASMEECRPAYPRLALHANGGSLMRRINRLLAEPKPNAASGFAGVPLIALIAVMGSSMAVVHKVRPDLTVKPIAALRHIAEVIVPPTPKPVIKLAPVALDRADVPSFVLPWAPDGQVTKPPKSEDPVYAGRVVGADGNPVPNADLILTVVPVNPNAVYYGQTDAAGNFRMTPHLKDEQKPYGLYAFVAGKGIGHIGLNAPNSDITVPLAPAVRVSLKLLTPDGKPVAGVTVTPESLHGSGSGDSNMWDLPVKIVSRLAAVSKNDGAVTFDGLPQAQYLRVVLNSDQYVNPDPRDDVLLPSSPNAEAELKISPASVIEGRLLHDGKGIGGQQIQAYGSDTDTSKQVWTDEQGRFRLGQLPAGKYVLFAQLRPNVASELVAMGRRVDLAKGQVAQGQDLELTPGQVVSGKVTTPDGKPLAKTDVVINGPTKDESLWSQGTATAEDGTYRLRVPAGHQIIAFWPRANWLAGQRQTYVDTDVAEGEAKTVNWIAPAPPEQHQIKGVVLDSEGKPVSGAEVEVTTTTSFMSYHVVSDAQGRFYLPVRPEEEPFCALRATKGSLGMIESVYPENGRATLRLSPNVWSSLKGRVIDIEGKPVANAEVNVSPTFTNPATVAAHSTDPRPRVPRPLFQTRVGVVKTDANGYYSFSHVLAFPRVMISVLAGAGKNLQGLRYADLKPGHSEVAEPVIVGIKGAFIDGVISTADSNRPIAATISVKEYPGISTKTDRNGYFRLDHLPAGKVTLVVAAADGRQEVATNAGAYVEVHL